MSGKSLMEQIIRKLGLQNEPRIIEKATELLRLLELKSNKIVSTIGDYGKLTICIDLSATMLEIPFDSEAGIKSSGLRKSVYGNYRRIFEKFLDLNKPLGINEICLRLNLNEVSKKANEILNLYKNSIGENLSDVDLSHPQYPAMAVYQASKLDKKRISKAKFVEYSHLKPAQWSKLEQQWDKLLQTSDFGKQSTKRQITEEKESPKKAKINKLVKNNSKEREVEDYETWKSRMLTFANSELSDKENKR